MACPDPDQLALAVSGAGDTSQRRAVLDHAAGCEECHAAMMVLAATAAPGPSSGSPPGLDLSAGSASVLASGDSVDRYLLGAELGRGAMGVVYAARDPELDREVAVKVLRPNASAARLKREAQALARLAHPNVVRVYDVGEHGGQAFVAMELVRGANLRQWLRTPRGVDEVLAVLREAGEGLAAAHRAGLVHRDVKPDNVFVADDGGVRVGDFGLARSTELRSSDEPPDAAAATMPMAASAQLTATGALVGTPAYMAPEQDQGEATAASDQYAFCVMAWEALFGQRPILGTSFTELRDRARAGTITPPPAGREVPAPVERAIRRGLSPTAGARFASMDALLEALAPQVPRRWLVPAVVLAATAASGALILVATVVGGRGVPDRGAVCQAASAAIAADWTPALAARVAERTNDGTSSALAHWVERWRQRRLETCHAAGGASTSDPRVACLERARGSFRRIVAGVIEASASLRSDATVRLLPSLERCDVAGEPEKPPPAIAARVAALDDQLAAGELGALSRVPRFTREQVAALVAEAESIGFAPQRLRAQMLDGIVAGLTGDEGAAVDIFRAVMIAAEAQADDFTRARAGAHLALVLARVRNPEVGAIVTSARAALARAGQDASTESLLLTAEAAYAFGRDDFAAAAAAQERIIALTLERFGPDAPSLAESYAAAAGALGLAGDRARSVARSKDLADFMARRTQASGAPREEAAILGEDTTAMLMAGDFAKAREVTLRQIAHLRSMPVQEPMHLARTLTELARASELDGDCNEALRSYREAEAIYRRPVTEIAGTSAPDPAGVITGRVDAMLGQGGCLVDLGEHEAAVAVLRAALAEAEAGGATTVRDVPYARRILGQALSAAGKHDDAVAVLAPIVESFADAPPRPMTRGLTAFALAQSLWATGGVRDRERAHALADDAERALRLALAEGADPATPASRPLVPRARKQLAALAAWRASHPLPR